MIQKNAARLCKIVSRLSGLKVLVVGDIMLDKFLWGTVSRISPEAPVPVVLTKSESFMPGAASNVANNIRAFNADVCMCGVAGDDAEGRTLIAELAKNGINNDGIVIDSSRPTTFKTRIIAHHQQVVRIDKESSFPLDNNVVSRLISTAKAKIPEVDAVIIEDYGKGVVIPRVIKELLKVAKHHKKILLVDPKLEHVGFYKNVTAITPNRSEAETASGIRIKDAVSLKKAGDRLIRKLSCDAVLITLGEDGMALFQKTHDMVHIPTVAQEVYDVSGAGDTVISVFTMARAAGANMVEAAHISNIAGGIVVGKLGIAVCSPSELTSSLRHIKKNGLPATKKSYPSDSIFRRAKE